MAGFSGFGSAMQIVMWIVYILGALIVGVMIVGSVILIMMKAKEKIILEVNMITRKVTQFGGRERKNKSGRRQIWIPKLKKWIPRLQEEDVFLKGKKDMIVLLKDNNGLHHSLRTPTIEELKDWYRVVHDVDLDEWKEMIDKELESEGIQDETQKRYGLLEKIKTKFQGGIITDKALEILGTIYLLPNPLEDLNWLADQCVEADKTFTAEWWKSPAFMWIGTLAACIFFALIWFMIMKKM